MIVLGGHVQGYGIVRICGKNKIPCIVIDTKKYNIAKNSKYCKCFYKIEYEKLLSVLLEFKDKNLYKNWLLIPTDDYYVRIISQNKAILDSHFKVTVDDWEKVNLFYDKSNSYPLAKATGVPIPKTYYPLSINDLKIIKDEISFPCIIKPAIMKDFYTVFKRKVFICSDDSELEKYYLLTSRKLKSREILIQEIIPGSSENQYSVGIFFDRSRSYNFIVGRRARQHPIDFGNATTYAETQEIPILLDYAKRILSKANIFGIFEVEFKFDERDGVYKFLEVNPRFWKWHIIAETSDVPFLKSIYSYFYNGEPIITNGFTKSAWRDIVTDIPVILEMMNKNVFRIKKYSKTIQAVWNWEDPLPFIAQVMLLPYFFIKRS